MDMITDFEWCGDDLSEGSIGDDPLNNRRALRGEVNSLEEMRKLPPSAHKAFKVRSRYYFTGLACVNGHVGKRYTSTKACYSCAQETNARREELRRQTKPARRKAECARYYKKNRAAIRAKQKARTDANKGKKKAADAKRRAREISAPGQYSGDDVVRIYNQQGGKCASCRCVLPDDYHVDHIEPLARGGSNWPRNIQILCPSCNVGKHASDPIDFAQSRGLLL